jgi:(1->4)-alpha-D-glucan 1-alpha-D-glucosylmutase
MVAAPAEMVPRATYRLQMHAGFGFAAARAAVPYLAALGVSHVYASPITMARPGSTHGYDVIDFNRLNPELGEEAEFEALIATLHEHGMGLVLDFVPNHMGVGSDNPWWLDVLEWGQASPFATFFDIDWEATARGPRGKIMLPVLGDQYGKVLEAGDLKLHFEASSGTFQVTYFENRFPIAVRHYPDLLRQAGNLLPEGGAALFEIAESFEKVGGDAAPSRAVANRQEAFGLKAELARVAIEPSVLNAIEAAAAARNGTPGLPASFRPLHELLEDQAYRLAYWRVASSEINYRRFFDINDLAGLRMERSEVFEATHRLLLRLVAEGKVQGIRLDHIDGLYDPAGYCRRLLSRIAEILPRDEQGAPVPIEPRAGRPVYLLVEKILARHEHLREDLPVAGSTGYEFMILLGGLFVDPAAERPMTAAYARFVGHVPDYGAVLLAAKRQILRYSLASELHVLAHEFYRLAQQSWLTRDFTLTGLREALTDIITRFPVYRTYITDAGPKPEDRRDLDWAINHARKETGIVDQSVFDFLHAALITDLGGLRDYRRRDVLATAMHFQQLTGPVMAKSLEDTTFYRYNRLVSLNEVGGEPEHFGTTPSAFHTVIGRQQRFLPLSMLTSSTHDHKRGEDTRARINVLSELPQEWRRRARRWSNLNRYSRTEAGGRRIPSANDEYLLYQTLVGAWPLEIRAPEELAGSDLAERIVAYMMKAIREAKQETSWTAPDPDYETGVEQFVRRVLDPERGRPFLLDFLPFQQQVAVAGAANGLAQVLIKLTVPGVPDLYQGTELWDLSLVDPDNRRPVDYALRREYLAMFEGGDLDLGDLVRGWQNGALKQLVIARTLALRREQPDLFIGGSYVSLAAGGEYAERLFAFSREQGGRRLIVAAPRLIAPLLEGSEVPLPPPGRWADTHLVLPEDLPRGIFTDVLSGRAHSLEPGGRMAVGDLLSHLPVALLFGEAPAG